MHAAPGTTILTARSAPFSAADVGPVDPLGVRVPLDLVGLSQLTSITRGDRDVVIGLSDGPVDATHPGLTAETLRIVPGTSAHVFDRRRSMWPRDVRRRCAECGTRLRGTRALPWLHGCARCPTAHPVHVRRAPRTSSRTSAGRHPPASRYRWPAWPVACSARCRPSIRGRSPPAPATGSELPAPPYGPCALPGTPRPNPAPRRPRRTPAAPPSPPPRPPRTARGRPAGTPPAGTAGPRSAAVSRSARRTHGPRTKRCCHAALGRVTVTSHHDREPAQLRVPQHLDGGEELVQVDVQHPSAHGVSVELQPPLLRRRMRAGHAGPDQAAEVRRRVADGVPGSG